MTPKEICVCSFGEKKALRKLKRVDILSKETHCTVRVWIQFWTVTLGTTVRLFGGLQNHLRDPFSVSGFWFIWSQGWPLTQVCTAWLHSLLPHHYQQPQWRECFLAEGQRVALALTFCLILTARAQCGRGWAGLEPQKSLRSWLSTSRELLWSLGTVRQPAWHCTLSQDEWRYFTEFLRLNS